mgnify:FL=1
MIGSDVFHLRLSNLEIQAERILDSSIKGRPLAVISSHNSDGIILSLSKEALSEGLRKGMRVSKSRKMSASTLLLPYNVHLYRRLYKYIYKSLSKFTPIVEPYKLGQFFLDMSGMNSIYGNNQDAGSSIIKTIREQTNVFSVIGISRNKLVSKIITAITPEPIHKIEVGGEAQFLAPLDPSFLPSTHIKYVNSIIRFLMIKKIKDIQSIANNYKYFQALFGIHATSLENESRGAYSSCIKPSTLSDNMLVQKVLSVDSNDSNILYAALRALSDDLAFRLKKRKQVANKMSLEIHYSDGYSANSIGSLKFNDSQYVFNTCFKIFNKLNKRRNRVRSILMNASHFQSYLRQEYLFSSKESSAIKISEVVDAIRSKYGLQSIQYANILRAQKTNQCLSI